MTTLHSLVVASSPDGYWPLTEASGTTAADDSGNGHAGTFNNVTLNQTGLDLSQPSVGAARFNGPNGSSYVSIPALPKAGNNAFSVMALVKMDDVPSNRYTIVDFPNTSPQLGLWVENDGGGASVVMYQVSDSTYSASRVIFDGLPESSATNALLVVLRFTSGGVMDLWENGAQVMSYNGFPGAHTFDTSSGSGSNQIGDCNGYSNRGAKGIAEHVAYWNRALTDTEIADFTSAALTATPHGIEVTEDADTSSFAMSAINAVLAINEGADTPALSMSAINFVLASTEGGDTAALTLDELADRMDITESGDTASFSLAKIYQAAFAVSDAGDTATVRFINTNAFLTESFALADSTPAMDVIHVIRERMALTDTPSSQLSGIVSIVDRANFTSALSIARQILLTEGVSFADSVTVRRSIVATLIEALVAKDAVSSRLEAVSLISIALALNESATAALSLDLIEAFNLDDSLAAKWVAYVTAIESAVFADTPTMKRKAVLTITEPAVFADTATASARLQALLSDSIGFNGVLLLEGLEYDAWALTTSTGAPSRYTNFRFDSMCRLGDRYYGVNDQGLYLLDGDDDDGDEIVASILTGELDFGSPNLKRIDTAHIGVTTDGDVVLKVTTSNKGVKREDWYRAVKAAGETTEQRAKFGKALKSQYWQFEILNTQGKELDLDKLALRVLELSRRV